MSTDSDLVNQAIMQVLETRPGERVLRQDYGAPDLIWESLAPVLVADGILQALKAGISKAIPGIQFQVNADEPDDSGSYLLNITWQANQLPSSSLVLRVKN